MSPKSDNSLNFYTDFSKKCQHLCRIIYRNANKPERTLDKPSGRGTRMMLATPFPEQHTVSQ